MTPVIVDLQIAASLRIGTPAHARTVQAMNRLAKEVHRLHSGDWIDDAESTARQVPK
jgi:hypothetical protein